MGKHSVGEVPHQRYGLGVEIAKHGIAFPPAHKPDGVGIHAATQQGHGTTSMQAAGIHVRRAKTDVREGCGSSAEQGGDAVAGDVVPAGAHKVGAQGGRQRKACGAEVDSANEGLGEARHGVPAVAVSDDLATFPVLLGVERPGTVGATVQVCRGCGEKCKAGGTDEEGDIRQGERGILHGLAMLAGPEKIEISNPGHVDGGLGLGRRATNGLCSV